MSIKRSKMPLWVLLTSILAAVLVTVIIPERTPERTAFLYGIGLLFWLSIIWWVVQETKALNMNTLGWVLAVVFFPLSLIVFAYVRWRMTRFMAGR